MKRLMSVTAAVALSLAALALHADDKGGLPPDLAMVPGKAGAFLSMRPADLWDHTLAKSIRAQLGKDADFVTENLGKYAGLPPAELERLTVVMLQVGPGSGPSPLTFFTAKKPFDRQKLLDKIVPKGTEQVHAGKKFVAYEGYGAMILDDKTYVLGTVGDIQAVIDAGGAKADSPMMPALKLAAGKLALVGALNGESFRPAAEELPADFEPFKPLFQADLATATLDAGASFKMEMRFKFPGAAEAKAGTKSVEAGRKMLLSLLDQFGMQGGKVVEMAGLIALSKQAAKELERAKVQQDGTALSLAVEMKMDEKAVAPVIAEAVVKVRLAAQRMTSSNNLKQIALAMHNYESAIGHFPPNAVYDKDGKALLSWRVLILPFIEQDALYKEFKLDEAWDSPHNKKLIARMPKIYELPNAKTQNQYGTFYQVFYGKSAAFEGKTGNRIVAFTDGTSNTMLGAEAASDVVWTKPQDIAFDAAKDPPVLGDHHGGISMAMFADGSVRAIIKTIKKDSLKALITRDGGEVIVE